MCTPPAALAALLLSCIAFAVGDASNALPPAHPPPPSAAYDLAAPPTRALPPRSAADFLADHGHSLGANARNTFAIAAPGVEPFDVADHGRWDAVPGGRVLRLALATPGAPGHVLIFSSARLPPGGTLHVYGSAASAGPGGCGSGCHHYTPATLPPGRGLTTLQLPGGAAVVEAFVPDGADDGAAATPALKLRVERVMRVLEAVGIHDAAAVEAGRASSGAGDAGPSPAHPNPARRLAGLSPGTMFDLSTIQQRSDATARCTPSAVCAPEFKDAAAAVISIYAINLQIGAIALCTGTIINAPMGAKHLLTAHHCLYDDTNINSFEYWVLLFNHEASCGSLAAPAATQVMQGVRLKFYDSKADVLLLSLPYPVPDRFKHYRLGFDASPSHSVPSRAVIIHHPNGNFKRISYVNDSASIRQVYTAKRFPKGEIQPTDLTHLEVKYTKGATQGGSSGAPLIDWDSKRVVGILSGGFAVCSDPSRPDYFGRLDRAWDTGLKQFLSSKPPANLTLDVAEAIVQQAEGKVVVDRLKGKVPDNHGPSIGFYPTFLSFGANDTNLTLAYFLTDPPWANETISMEVKVSTAVAGNVDGGQGLNLTLSTSADDFKLDDWQARERLITVSRPPGPVPGGLARFRLVFSLTADVDESYQGINTVAGIVQEQRVPWHARPALPACASLPCSSDTRDSPVPLDAAAVMEYTAGPEPETVSTDVCMQNGVASTATVSIYINKRFAWTLSRDPFGDPDCIHIAGIDLPANATAHAVVSDSMDFDAVLPVRLLQRVMLSRAPPSARVRSAGVGPAPAPSAAPSPGPDGAAQAPSPPQVGGTALPESTTAVKAGSTGFDTKPQPAGGAKGNVRSLPPNIDAGSAVAAEQRSRREAAQP